MEEIIRNVSDLGSQERQAYEVVVGHKLLDNQQVMVRVVTPPIPATAEVPELLPSGLPDWCNVYAGLTESEIASLEEVITHRADLTRS